MIQPTVGKRLWYWPTRATGVEESYDLSNQPLAGTITYVNHDGTVNLSYLDRNGTPDRQISVNLWQLPLKRPVSNFCEYHPDDIAIATGAKMPSLAPAAPSGRSVLSIKK